MTVRRRQFLATTALLSVSLAGCGHPPNVLDMQEATPERLTDEVSRPISPDTNGYETIREAVETDAATVWGTSLPLDTDTPVRFRGRYYDLSVTEVGSRERDSYVIRVDYDPESVESGDAIAYEDLPAVDREALDGVVPPRGDPPEGDGFEMGTRYLYPENATDSSVLAPRQQYELVRHRNSTYRLRVDAEPVTETEYRYTATEIAASTEAYAEQLRSTYQFELSGLSSAERDVVEKAIDEGYFGEANDAFRGVVARFRAHRGIDASDSYGTWLPVYRGTPYVAYAEFPPDVTAAERPE